MSDKGEDDAQTVDFESLTLEEDGKEEPSKLTEILSFLKEHLDAEKYTEVLAKFGVEDEMSNAQLYEALKTLIKKPEEEEEEDDDDKKKEAQDGEEDGKEKPDRAAFMKECMAGGKDLAECTEEWKKKYPEPEKKEEGTDDAVPTALEEQMKKMEDRIAELEGEKQLGEVSKEVEKLVQEKHLAPVQRDAIIKLSAKMNPEERGELLDFFRSTQKISVHTDVGHLESDAPGAGGAVLDSARKRELIELHGLEGLIMDKADRSKLSFLEDN